MTKYYRHAGKVWAFAADGSQDAWIPDGATLMTPTEVESHLNPPVIPYVPQTLSRFQARAGLMQRGLLADVEALVASSSPLAQLAWAETIEWRRDSPTLNSLAKDGLGLTDAEIDELFIEAAQIQA